MTINVIDFYREKDGESLHNPFLLSLQGPTFGILADVDGKRKELILKLSGSVEYPSTKGLKDFDAESYGNYIIITNFLLGENREILRQNWGLSKEDFRELFFELYVCLLKEHTTCGLFKKALLMFIGLWKFYAGRKLK